jgi:hypothetical protein
MYMSDTKTNMKVKGRAVSGTLLFLTQAGTYVSIYWQMFGVRRGIILVNRCMCKSSSETVDHLLIHCTTGKEMCSFVFTMFEALGAI